MPHADPAARQAYNREYKRANRDRSGCDDAIETGQQIAGMTDGTYRHVICVTEWAS